MIRSLAIASFLLFAAPALKAPEGAPDLILHGGKIVTVDGRFSVRQAMAVKDGRILRVGGNREVLGLRGAGTRVVDLGGKTVLPGLIDSHTHPTGACMT